MIILLERLVLAVGGSWPASIVAKATVIAALGLIGTRLARRSSAAARHVLLAAAFGVLLLLPVISLVVPPFQIAVRTVGQEPAMLLSAPAGVDSTPSLSQAGTHAIAFPDRSRSLLPSLSTLLFFAWFAGVALSLIPVVMGLERIRALRRTGLPWTSGQELVNRLARESGIGNSVEALLHEALPGPIAFGALHPAILLPDSAQRWKREDLHRALVHELEHVRRIDVVVHSLARAVCSLYWFHPLVWMAWRRMMLEAERACDDVVIARSEATAYADQLLALARKLLASEESPLLAMANRSHLAVRVRAVLDERQCRGRAGRFIVAFACAAAVVLTFTISPLRTVSARQSAAVRTTAGPSPTFEVATIKPDRSSGLTRFDGILPGRFTATHVKAKALIAYAYNVRDFQISGGPDWINSAEYDIVAKPDDAEAAKLGKAPWEQYREEYGLLVQSLLVERFKLTVSRATKELPVYALVVAKNGSKLTPTKGPPGGPGPKRGPWISMGHGQLNSAGMSLADLADTLSLCPDVEGRKVLDLTGLTGKYDIRLQWAPLENQPAIPVGSNGGGHDTGSSQPDSSGPALFTALQQQLGLKLESTKGTVEIIVIDHIERPSEN